MDETSGTTAPEARSVLDITPARGSLLEQLRERHHLAKARLAEAAEDEKNLRLQIEAEITQAHPGVHQFRIAGTPGCPAVNLTWVRTSKTDNKALDRDHPGLRDRYKVAGGRWEMREA